jgi:hypothetical protein
MDENNQRVEIPKVLVALLENTVGFQASLFKLNDRFLRIGHG